MKTKRTTFSSKAEETIQKIHSIDLSMIEMKLKSQKGGNWSETKVKEGIKWYKRFLILNVKYPTKSIVPTAIIDEVWHTHILDTRKYAEDCQTVFGYFVHHFPYFGLRSHEDAVKSKQAFEETLMLFELEFNESPVKKQVVFAGVDAAACQTKDCSNGECTSSSPSSCYRSCKSK